MRRAPFYAYPSSFYSPPAEASYRRPRRPAPTPRSSSIINIPVFDSAPSWPSSSPPPHQPHPITPPASTSSAPAVPFIDPSSAATTIQSRFRGFCVRKHRPLLHLRSIAKARKQLEALQSELQSPGFPLKVRASEKERLRFSESVMAIILRLDAIEGSMAEVRSQRKEATKMAIKLQDVLDAIMMQKDEIADTDVCVPVDNNSHLCEQSDGRGVHALSDIGIMDVSAMEEVSTSPEGDLADECLPNVRNDDVIIVDAEIVSPLGTPPKLEDDDVDQQVEVGEHLTSKSGCCFESVTPLEGMHDAEQDMSQVTRQDNATHAAEEEVKDNIDVLHQVAHDDDHMQDSALVADMGQNTMDVAHHGSAEGVFSKTPYTCMDAGQEIKEGCSQDVELCPGTPTAEEKCDYPHFSNAAHHLEPRGQSTALERLTEGNCSSDGLGSPTLPRHGHENRRDEAYENPTDEVKAQSSPLSLSGTPSPLPDDALLHQLSEDCRQLKSLVGKLLVQNKAQSKVLCALGERLELLEHQQHLNCQRNQQLMREKRKLKKGSKRSVKCRNCE